ncbi:glutathionylspermidine synthase [Bacillus sp. SA1-12]|uniref:glutathionylspermidine synthase family protein n=1 Tax=Bacillus sp. SA1-12 TaxID=1455638 RepID=UPI0006271334|nr:glutathionylspermidine synthase family protein [Bacillus sp. SA1-12]KKI89353.1 glutathionylspermidine synthase [Bacillus sp. SA1-12]
MSHSFYLEEHLSKRRYAYSKVNQFWHDLYDSEYALYDIALMAEKEVADIRLATKRIGHIFFKTGNLLRSSSDETLLQLDLPRSILPFIRHRALPVDSVISRVDLVQTKNGLKVLELNSDTPTFEKEVFYVNGVMCKEFGVEDPNKGLAEKLGKEMRKALAEMLHRSEIDHEPNIVFTSHEDHEEDKFTTLFLKETVNVPSKYVPLHKLTIKKQEGLFDDEGNRIDLLYRQTYPLEHLIEDADVKTNEEIGLQLIELVSLNKLHMVNPISAFLLQSKAVQAVIWGMMERDNPYFTAEEKQWISAYFLPTYLEEDIFLKSGVKYVKKPSFGREGDTVSIYKGKEKILEDAQKTYDKSLPVFQKYIDLPAKEIKTSEGIREGKVLIGSFLINGKPSGIGLRAGKQITDNNAYFLPVGLKR